MWRRFLFILSLVLFLAVGFSARAYSNPGKPTGFVNDFAGVLNSSDVSSLNEKLTQFNNSTSNEISVVIIKSLDGDTIENYAVKLFEDWKIGKAKKDNGVLVLVAYNDHQMRIEVGYGLEGALTDIQSNEIINNQMRPAFQKGDYYGGLNQATDQIIAATKGEYTAEPATAAPLSINVNNATDIFWFVVLMFYILNALWRYLAKSRSWYEGGILGLIIGFLIAIIFLRTLIYLIALPLGFCVLGFIFDFLVSRVLPKPKPRKGKGGNNFWFFGGGPGGFGGGSGGGGGFGGFGGGGSGGGGASGGW